MDIAEGYKLTEIGVIPEDWDVKEIGNCLTVGHGRDYKHLSKGNIPVYGTGGYMTSVDDYLYEGDTVCIGRKGTIDVPQFHTGKIWTVDTLFYSHSFVNVVPKLLYYIYQTIDWYSYNEATGVPSLTAKAIEKIKIALPHDVVEQKLIVDYLTEIEDFIKSLDSSISKKKQLKEGTMQQLLTGKTRLPGFSGAWLDKRIGKIGYTYSGITGKGKDDFGKGDAQYITFLNVLNNPVIDTTIFEKVDIKPSDRQNAAQKGDLFFNTSSETPEEVGICAVLNENIENLYLNSFCFGYRLIDNAVLGHYLSYFWRSKQGRNIMSTLAQGATRYNLSKVYFNQTVIALPPTKEEQMAIVEVLDSMDSEIQALKAERDKYLQIKQGMMQKLLTGQIRLK